jgi:hypothetical protein
MYLRNRENISLTKKKKLQRKQKGGLTIKQRLAILKNSISPSHIFTFRNRSNKVEQDVTASEPLQPKKKRTSSRSTSRATRSRTKTTRKKATETAIATETTEAAEIAKIVELAKTQAQQLIDNENQNARLAAAANIAFETESAKIAQESQKLSDELARAMFGEEAIVTNSPVTLYSNTLSPDEEAELLAELDADGTSFDTLSLDEENELLQELEKSKRKGGKKSRTHRKPKRARK